MPDLGIQEWHLDPDLLGAIRRATACSTIPAIARDCCQRLAIRYDHATTRGGYPAPALPFAQILIDHLA